MKLEEDLNKNNYIWPTYSTVCLFNFTLATTALQLEGQSLLSNNFSITTWCYSYDNNTLFLCAVTARMMLSCVQDLDTQHMQTQQSMSHSWVICMDPSICLQMWQLFCMGISKWPPPPSTQPGLLSAEHHSRRVAINIINLYVFLSCADGMNVKHMVTMRRGESG